MKRILLKLGELIFGVIIGFLVYKLTSNQPQANYNGLIGIVTGLLSSMIISILIEGSITHKKIDNLKLDIQRLKELLADVEKFKSKLVKRIDENPVTIIKDDIPNLWLELLWEAEQRYWATTYIKSTEGWDKVYTEIGNHIQKAKIQANDVDICRIFVIDDLIELESLKKHINKQHNIAIKTKYIFKDDIYDNPLWDNYTKALKSLDFSIVDDKYVSLLFMDDERNIHHAEVCKMNDKNKFYENFFRELFKEAKTIKKTKTR
ncbi:MAG: hypothetical protein WC240_05535 [Bacilli bacterium]|jgi:hypothetical protein